MALQLCRDPLRAARLVHAVAVIGFGYAVFGLVQFANLPNPLLWFDTNHQNVVLTSTFVGRNNYATYAGIGLIAIAGITLRVYQQHLNDAPNSARYKLAAFIEASGQRGAIFICAGLVVLVALLLTQSRAGVLATLVGLLALGILNASRSGQGHSRAIILLAVFAVAGACLAFGDAFLSRISRMPLSDEYRSAVYAITLASIREAPLTGFGYGTFADVLPMFRDGSLDLRETWDKAHNTYLELLQGLGVVAGSMLMLCVGLLVWRCARGAIRRRRHRLAPTVAAACAVLVTAHALVDFSLQIQAVTLTFAALLGAGVAQSDSSRATAGPITR